MKINQKIIAITAIALLAISCQSAIAAVGYNRILVPAAQSATVPTDVLFSIPFTQKAEGTFVVNTKTATGVTVTNTLTANAFANAYYVRFTTGNGAGLWTTISANTVSELTLADAGVRNLVNPGDSFIVFKHQTLGSVFRQGQLGKSYLVGTKVLMFENNLAAMSQNKSAAKVATYSASNGGRWSGAGVNNDTILKPETMFILRNNAAQTLTLVLRGEVPEYPVSLLIAPDGDLNIGSGYPVPVVLKYAGLGSTGRKVIFYNNTSTGQNKSASLIANYQAATGNWVGAGVSNATVIKPSEAVSFRLPLTETGTKVTIVKPY